MNAATGVFDSVHAVEVSKIYGRHRALAGVNLSLSSGKVTALLGPNGSGKTTLLMLFSTLSRPSSGTVRFGAKAERPDATVRGKIGLLSHSAMTYGELTAKENLCFFARLYGLNNPLERSISLLKRFDLINSMERPVSTFSRGMLQRLGLARALIGEPKLLLLDEPFTGLDSDSTNTVVKVVEEHRASGGIALMISHDLNVASRLGDEFVVLKRGKQIAHLAQRLEATALRETYAEVTA